VTTFLSLLDYLLQDFHRKANSQTLRGRLLDQDGNEMQIPPDNTVGKIGFPDIMNISLLLQAAGIPSLDGRCINPPPLFSFLYFPRN